MFLYDATEIQKEVNISNSKIPSYPTRKKERKREREKERKREREKKRERPHMCISIL